MADHPAHRLLGLTATIVAAHLQKNQVSVASLPALITAVHHSLSTVGVEEPPPTQRAPAVPWKKSIFPTYIICLEDGQKLTMLKRHLRVKYGLTPGDYRQKWNLPDDYPMVAPEYATRRSDLAKSFGLGRRPAPDAEPKLTKVPARRTRGAT